MARPALEVADIFRDHGPAWRHANAGHVSLGQMKVMSAIESCRTAALGGHVERCEDCAHTRIAYNSCRNRHCPKCQATAAKEWLAEREAELLPVPYYHVVFTLPAPIADIAYQNKAAIYDLLFKASAETLIAIAADPKHLGARIGVTSVLHTWGSAMTHHPHVHMIVPGGGIAPDGQRWVSCRTGFFLPVRVLSRLFRRLFLEKLTAAHKAGRLKFFGNHAALADTLAFAAYLAPLRKIEWVVYAKRPFGGPEAVPVLRGTNDRHRDLRARLLSAHASHPLNQDRHVMTNITTSQCQNARLRRRSSSGHSGTRSDTQLQPQLNRSPSFTVRGFDRSELLIHRNSLEQSARSRCLNSHVSSAALKSP